MFEMLLWLVPILLDLGNIVMFLATLPQLITAWKNRRNLSGLSTTMVIGYIIANLIFALVGLISGAYFALVLSSGNCVFFVMQLFWKWKYRNG